MKKAHLLQRYDGITVVWVDDRVLVEEAELLTLKENGIQTDSATCMDEAWITAVTARDSDAVDAMLITEQQKYATIALGLMEVCTECRVNLILVDFEEAHANWFRVPNAIFLLDIQNLMKPIQRFFLEDGIDASSWDWDLYGLHCAVAYGIPLSRFRFLTRFRAQIAGNLPAWANPLFPDYGVFEKNAVLIDANISIVKQLIEGFIKDNLLHDDPCITEMLLWFLCLPLTQDGMANHNILGMTRVLEQMDSKLDVTGTQADSAKAVALGAGNWPVCCTSTDCYKLQVSVLLGILKALAVANVQLEGLSASDWLSLPCAPGLPMFLALKALIYEMNRCPKYCGPTAVIIAAICKEFLPSEYRMALLLSDKARDGTPVNMDVFKSSFEDWDQAGRQTSERHQTRQRIGDLLRCKLTLRNEYIPPDKPLLLRGSDADVLRVEFNDYPSRIEFIWKA